MTMLVFETLRLGYVTILKTFLFRIKLVVTYKILQQWSYIVLKLVFECLFINND